MGSMAKDSITSVYGHHIPAPRWTRTAYRLLFLYLIVPLLVLLLGIDIALYLLFTEGMERCYGIFCWL